MSEENNQTKIKLSELPEYIQRMHKEYTELGEKIQKAASFLESEEGKKLDITRKNLLTTQMSCMIAYSNVLSIRLSTEIGIAKSMVNSKEENEKKPEVIKPEVVS